MKSSNEQSFIANSWRGTPVYGCHDYPAQQQRQQQLHQYVHPQLSYDDARYQYSAICTGSQGYAVLPGAAYTGPEASAVPRPRYDDPADNMATTGNCATPTGNGSAYGVNALPDVVGGHLQGWVCPGQDSLQQDESRSRSLRRGKRSRTSFTSEQLMELERQFRLNEYLSRTPRIQMSLALNLTERQIKIWFQNRRMKQKRDRQQEEQSDVTPTTPDDDGCSPTQTHPKPEVENLSAVSRCAQIIAAGRPAGETIATNVSEATTYWSRDPEVDSTTTTSARPKTDALSVYSDVAENISTPGLYHAEHWSYQKSTVPNDASYGYKPEDNSGHVVYPGSVQWVQCGGRSRQMPWQGYSTHFRSDWAEHARNNTSGFYHQPLPSGGYAYYT